ncbi:hypothetical protein ACNVED_16210 (plasmid) [Legionella sp. D16C41]|uniref:hypothetical protein n=1 Tax=Legionella sp. D16C41 TaxID=3402688 RepID=UPI003AF8CC15
MKSKDESKKINACPACGVMSFPPLFKKESDKAPLPAQIENLTPTTEEINEITGCPACGQMSFTSFNK